MPTSVPAALNAENRFSVATLPPAPPAETSKPAMPKVFQATIALATARPKVLWRCRERLSLVTTLSRRKRSLRTSSGEALPTVSPMENSLTPIPESILTTSAALSGRTWPSYGHQNAAVTQPRTGRRAARARATTGRSSDIVSLMEALQSLWLEFSVADASTQILSAFTARARSRPTGLGTTAE